MINSLEIYRDTGEKAGKAQRHHDSALASFHHDWLRKALALEEPADREQARKAYDDAYRMAATPEHRPFESKTERAANTIKRLLIESPQKNQVNKELHAIGLEFHDGIPVDKIQAILDKYGFGVNTDTGDPVTGGIYTGRDGSMHEPVGKNVGFVMTWHKMDSGRYEIVAYVS